MNFKSFFGRNPERKTQQVSAESQPDHSDTLDAFAAANTTISLKELLSLEKSLSRKKLYTWLTFAISLLFLVSAILLFQQDRFLSVFQTIPIPTAWYRIIIVFVGFVGIYPVSYLAYRAFSDDAKRTRLKDEFELFGLVSEDKLDETVDTLYRNVYNWKQFSAYILLIILVNIVIFFVFFGQWYTNLISAEVIKVVVYGYLGAYVFSVQELIRRYNTFDLQPQVYSSILVRFLIAIVITFILASLQLSDNSSAPISIAAPAVILETGTVAPAGGISSTNNISTPTVITLSTTSGTIGAANTGEGDTPLSTWIIIVAFVIGIFPTIGIRWFVSQANRFLNPPISQESELPLRNLLGISTWHEARLSMMGIDDAQNLATVDIPRLLLTTQFDTQQVANWIDQAILYVKIGNRISRFREAKITTFHEFLQTLHSLDARPQLLVNPSDSTNPNEERSPNSTETKPEQRLTNLSTVLGLTSADELRRLGDYSNFPNYTHITSYYEGTARVGSQRAETSIQRLTSGGVLERLRKRLSVDPVQQSVLTRELERLLNQPLSRFKDHRYCTKLGDTYYQLGKIAEARACLTRAIQLNCNASDAYYSLSLVYLDDKKHEQAVWKVTQAIALDGTDAEMYNLRGSIYIEMQQYEQALPDLTQAIQLDRQLTVAYYNRSLAHNALTHFEDAIRDVERARLLGYDDFGLWFVWGVALLGSDDNKGAIEKLTQAIMRTSESVDSLGKSTATELKADLADAFANRGTAYLNLGSLFLDQAEQDFEASTTLNNKLYQCYNRLGIIADHRRKYQDAIAYFTRALKISGENVDIRYNLGDVYFKARDFDKALRQYQELHRWSKENALTPEQQIKLQSLAERLNLSDTRLQRLQEALRLNETINDQVGMALAQRQVAHYYRELGETEIAIDHYMKASKLYEQVGKAEEQKEIELDIAVLRNPKN